jgi:hypothetical protein
MPNFEVLDPKQHQTLRVNTQPGAAFGDDVMSAMVFPFEFRTLQAEYPILFRKDGQTGQFYALALLGLEPKENLYLDGAQWIARYLPLSARRAPFLITERESIDDQKAAELLVSIDLDHPRTHHPDGELVFNEDGSNSALLDSTIQCLGDIHAGHEQTQHYFDALSALNLITPMSLEVPLEAPLELTGFYGIDEDQLAALNDADLKQLQRAGGLEHTYMALASLSQLSGLIQKKHHRILNALDH